MPVRSVRGVPPAAMSHLSLTHRVAASNTAPRWGIITAFATAGDHRRRLARSHFNDPPHSPFLSLFSKFIHNHHERGWLVRAQGGGESRGADCL